MLHEDVVHEVPVVDVVDVHVDVDAVATSRGFYVLATHTHPHTHTTRISAIHCCCPSIVVFVVLCALFYNTVTRPYAHTATHASLPSCPWEKLLNFGISI